MRRRRTTSRCIWHCSATPADLDVTVADITRWHRSRRPVPFETIGYHRVIYRDGTVHQGRDDEMVGAHAVHHNQDTYAICVVGGAGDDGRGELNFTAAQVASIWREKERADRLYPGIEHLGHRDLSPDADRDGVVERHEWFKDCPSFCVRSSFELGEIVEGVPSTPDAGGSWWDRFGG